MSWGVKLVWEEYKPCFPGTSTHNPSIGKWYAAGTGWMHDEWGREPVVFDCLADAARVAPAYAEKRSHAHPPFSMIAPARYGAIVSGEMMSCAGPDLSGLGGWLRDP
jgi:hypothetical protein